MVPTMLTTIKGAVPLLLTAVLLVPLSACKTNPTATPEAAASEGEGQGEAADDLEDREVVPNWEAQAGDVTVCPMSGRKFEVKENYDRYEYEGYTFVFCCANCIDKVRADPGKYLDPFVAEAQAAAQAED